VLAVGDLRRKKNLRRLVWAFSRLHSRGVIPHRLVLAGIDAGEGSALRSLAGSAPIELTGYVSDERLDALMRGADVLVHPSVYEGFGLVILEAMARGTPVLAAHATALPETGGSAAAYFDPYQGESIEEALQRVLMDGPLRERMVQEGLERAAAFSWAGTARETASVYTELL
jgi:glycosyltransferase involved in cell wall biosynthesis